MRVHAIADNSNLGFSNNTRIEKPSLLSRIFSCFASFIRAFLGLFYYQVPELKNVSFLFSQDEITKMRGQYWKLGAKKINEVQSVPPISEYDQSMINIRTNAFPFIDKYLGARMDAELFLQLHKAVCFDQVRKRGAFRDDGVEIRSIYRIGENIDKESLHEFTASGSGTYITKKDQWHISFTQMDKAKMGQRVDACFTQFYNAMKNRKTLTQQQKVSHIAKLAQTLYFLHPPRDGRKRTVLLVMQKLFTEYLGHPGIFKNIHRLPMRTLKQLEGDCLVALAHWESFLN